MGRRGKVAPKPNTRRRVQRKDDEGSDESDEDYTVAADEEVDESDEYCSLDGDESEDGLGGFREGMDEDDDDEEEEIIRVGRSKIQSKVTGVKNPREKKRVSYKVDDGDFEDEDEGFLPEDDTDCVDDEVVRPPNKKNKKSGRPPLRTDEDEEFLPEEETDCVSGDDDLPPAKKNKVRRPPSWVDEDEDEEFLPDDETFLLDDYVEVIPLPKKNKKVGRPPLRMDEDEDEDEDEEFLPDEDTDYVDDDEDAISLTKKNKKVGRPPVWTNDFTKRKKRKRTSKASKNLTRKRPRKNNWLARKTRSGNHQKFIGIEENSKKIGGQRRGRGKFLVNSDSDFVISGSSDYEYTISEEEREQVREASKFCTSLGTTLRSSSSSKSLQEATLCLQRERPRRKGKEKLENLKSEIVTQVCGICLSEEGKRTVRGTLNCCGHFFCFACIMEWSKVESRCPLCKQRFVSISKPSRSTTGFDLRMVAIQVPERDQVYQPTEEELRGYLDPYESVICTECQHGGDDALMLLCDICDSPAHTYCVGLGREVPEGNWYCEGCRPTAFASLNPQGINPTPGQRASDSSSPVRNFRDGIDLNEMYVPDTPLTQETGAFSSSRRSAASPSSGAAAFTVFERRRIQRQIHHILNNRMSHLAGRSSAVSPTSSGIRLFGTQLDRGREFASQQAITPERVAPHYSTPDGRLQNSTSSVHNWDLSSSRSSHFRGQEQNPDPASTDGTLQAELAGISMAFNSRLAYEQLHPCTSRSSIVSDANASPYASREVNDFNVEKGQVQQMVRSHLKSLSGDIELGYSGFKDITRSSTHTVLAACGLEHRGSDVYPMQPPSICNHIEGTRGDQMSLMKGCCSTCFDFFVKDVVKMIVKIKIAYIA